MRILHVGWAMTRGGVETWLTNVMGHIDRERYHFDFLVHTSEKQALDDELTELGARVIPAAASMSDMRRKPISYARSFEHMLREYGPFDAVHSHVDLYSGHVVRLAHHLGIPIRISHIHNDSAATYANAPTRRSRYYYHLLGYWIDHHSTVKLACSRHAAETAFGKDWEEEGSTQVLYQGVDLEAFGCLPEAARIRRELGIPAGVFVIGHVGRFVEAKNHRFLLDIASQAALSEPGTWLLVVGDGPLRADVERKARDEGLDGRTIFTGLRGDVPRLLAAMDVFVLPSTHEGLSMVLVEAQAAGLPCIISDVLPTDAEIVKPLVHRLPLCQPTAIWAKKALEVHSNPHRPPCEKCREAVAASPFNVLRGIEKLESLYDAEMRRATPRLPPHSLSPRRADRRD